MPRYEYTDHEGGQHVITAPTLADARAIAAGRVWRLTDSWRAGVRAAGTVEMSDERSRAA